MMLKVPENLASVPSPGGTFGLRWDPVEDADVQCWQLLRCDYPVSVRNGAGMLSGGMDLMLQRWELHPSTMCIFEDTGIEGKHYVVLGLDEGGQVHFPPGFGLAGQLPTDVTRLSDTAGLQGWVKGVKKKDRYSNVF